MAHRASSASAEPAPAGSLLVRFLQAERGATAVEFGIVAAPFIYLLMAILELAIVFWTSQVLETAVANASRQIYTGQFQQSAANVGIPPEQRLANFKQAVCSHVRALFDCNAKLDVDVRSFSSFAEATVPRPIRTSDGTYDPSGFGYMPPTANQIMIVRASLEYPVFVSLLAPFTGLSNGNRLIMASATFRTEPY